MSTSRNETAFFHDERTKRAVVRLASCDPLIIYCGAGVTIDRTGLGWSDLITALFKADQQPQGLDPTLPEVALLRQSLAPQQLASVLMERTLARYTSEAEAHRALVMRLPPLLYPGVGWKRGALVENIIRLAFGFAHLGRQVSIVTTNFDTYIEDEYHAWVARQRQRASELPGLIARAADSAEPFCVVPPHGNVGSIEVVYLHGRIPNEGKPGGQVVLTENEYAAQAGMVTTYLQSRFGRPGAGVLILGSSLTDPPLLSALSMTRGSERDASHEDPDRGEHPAYRAAIVPARSTQLTQYDDKYARLSQHLRTRAAHLGVGLLISDFHYQSAQFCQEVLTSLSLVDGPQGYLDSGSGVRYGPRLVGWWKEWSQRAESRGPESDFHLLRDLLNHVREYIVSHQDDRGLGGEPLKIELWVRHEPETTRRLALWASSAGVLWDREIIRTEELRWKPTNSSVRAFIEGRPQFVDLDDLVELPTGVNPRGRWRSFLSMPIRIDLPDGTLPVGVVTLASQNDKPTSSIPHETARSMDHIINMLKAAGQQLLRIY